MVNWLDDAPILTSGTNVNMSEKINFAMLKMIFFLKKTKEQRNFGVIRALSKRLDVFFIPFLCGIIFVCTSP